MYSFNSFLREMSMAAELDLNFEFIRKAEKVTSFNLVEKDFTSPKFKKEIRYLYVKNFFPNFNTDLFTKQVKADKLNKAIEALKKEDAARFNNLIGFTPGGLGPGEVMLYFLIDDAQLGGAGSAGVDVVVGSNKYEVKAVKVSKDDVASDFKLGGTVPLSNLIMSLNTLREKLNLGGSRTEMAKSIIDQMKKQAPDEYGKIEHSYQQITYNNYFKNHEIIFINNGSGPKYGTIEAVKQVKISDIMIERATSGTIKPLVKL
jgi:hypothetical protein